MANISFLLQQSSFNSNPSFKQSIYLPQRPSSPIKLRNHFPCTKTSPNFKSKCLIMNSNRKRETVLPDSNKIATVSDVNQVIWRSIGNLFKALQKPVISGVLLGLLLLHDHHHGCVAMAASGGRMGGTSFSSSYSSSSSSDSRSYSTRRPSSYSSSSSSIDYSGQTELVISVTVLVAMIVLIGVHSIPEKTSIIKLQVGLLGTATSLQKDLNQIAESADTSKPQGFRFILQGATVSLLQNLDYCVSAYSSVDVQRGVEKTEKQFNKLSVEERGKFDEETLVNVNNIKKRSATCHSDNRVPNEYIVVTIIAATSDVQELPAVKSSAQLKEALQKLASIPSYKIMAAEVLWTPQQENDYLTDAELLKDYSLLHPL